MCWKTAPRLEKIWPKCFVLGGILVLALFFGRSLLSVTFLNLGVVALHRAVVVGRADKMEVSHRYLQLSRNLHESTVALRNEGQLALAEQDYTTAEQALAQAAERCPEDRLVQWYLGQLYLATGRRELAVQAWRDAQAEEFFLHAGEVNYRAGQHAEARAHYELYLELVPGDAFALRRIGETYQAEDHLGLALEYYQAALAADPSQHRAYYQIASVYRLQGEWERAAEFYQQAIACAPGELMYYLAIAQTYDQMGQLDDSATWYARARQIAPDSELPYLYYGVSLLNQRRVDEALEQLALASARNEDNCLAHLYRGHALVSVSRLEEALEVFDRAAPYPGCSRSAHAMRAQIFRDTGRIDEALAEYRLLLELFPDYAPARTAIEELTQDTP